MSGIGRKMTLFFKVNSHAVLLGLKNPAFHFYSRPSTYPAYPPDCNLDKHLCSLGEGFRGREKCAVSRNALSYEIEAHILPFQDGDAGRKHEVESFGFIGFFYLDALIYLHTKSPPGNHREEVA
jgi:hypothetical protein